ncbi:MAG: PilZ domain-containing protein [Candidatus Aminicenantes bacterium]|jgi:c-di-GMP-binding flagellar brake protein YcgR
MKKESQKSNDEKKAKTILPRIDRDADRRQEWRFELPLSAIVEGTLPEGSKFKEETILENISSGGAYFSLESGITVGSKLNLVIEIPSKVTGGKKTKLCLGGLTVRLQKLDKEGKKQGIALSFDEDFQFQDEEK